MARVKRNGVHKGRMRLTDGIQMWTAHIYLGPRKWKYLGSYESPELAAAKVQAARARQEQK
uniref:AP2/ERF domain-containing protein n=1 Tax=viral metagenome TaxID=1070528 RepID=A0A6H1ZNK7_9ZZZZ